MSAQEQDNCHQHIESWLNSLLLTAGQVPIAVEVEYVYVDLDFDGDFDPYLKPSCIVAKCTYSPPAL
jgi:hypothetical protein